MNLSSRPYGGAADLALLQRFNSAAISAAGPCGYLHPGDIPHRIYNGHRNYDPADVARLFYRGDELVGWVMLYPKWHAFDLQLGPGHVDAGPEVLAWAEPATVAITQRAGKEAPTLNSDVYGGDDARRGLLEAAGYHEAGHIFTQTIRDLEGLGESSVPAGFTVRSVRGPEEAGAVAEVHAGAFGSEWTPESYRTFMATPGYDPERELVVEAPDGRLAAFTIIWHDTANGVGLFEPVGTHVDFHRLGLGRAVMQEGMRRMRAAGLRRASVTYEVDNDASKAFYESLGFRHHFAIHDFEKPV